MFSLVDLDYRAGLKIKGAGGARTYSLDFFMREFVAYWDMKAKLTRQINPILGVSVPLELSHPTLYWQASQSIPTGAIPLNSIDLDTPESHSTYHINHREIICPLNTNCYVIDRLLLAHHPDVFNKGVEISYAMLARFMLAAEIPSHQKLADVTLQMVNGTPIVTSAPAPEIEAMPILLAALLLAEPCRNPSTFLPTLMILELIAHQATSPSGAPYHWGNCIQNLQLIAQGIEANSSEIDYTLQSLYPRLTGMPTLSELCEGAEKKEKVEMTEDQKKKLNGEKKFNKTKGQYKVMPHEISMQAGGYFPATHRFSFSEIERKRAEGISTLADQKCFIAISDFLFMLGVGTPIHKHYLHHPRNKTDADTVFLKEAVLPFLWRMQQSRFPSENLGDLQYIPRATFTEVFRDHLQRSFVSEAGPGLYTDK